MKYGLLGFGLMMFGMIGLVIIVMFESITLDNDTDYYTLKEAMQASMYESIDYDYWSFSGDVVVELPDGRKIKRGGIKISEQKFVENFIRRFKANVGGDADDYKIEFYDIMESPPKATVKITGNNKSYKYISGDEGLNIVNNLTGILETVDKCNIVINKKKDDKSGELDVCYS